MSFPHPDYVFVAWCATGPLVDHNGAFILSRGRNLAGLADLPEVEAELLATAEKLGIDYDTMCESDNTDCPVWKVKLGNELGENAELNSCVF